MPSSTFTHSANDENMHTLVDALLVVFGGWAALSSILTTLAHIRLSSEISLAQNTGDLQNTLRDWVPVIALALVRLSFMQ